MKENNIKEEKKLYEAPRVEFVEVQVERGYTLSGWGDDSDDSEFFGPSPTY